MKIENKTKWRTDQLRAIIQRLAVEELDVEKRKKLKVEIVYLRPNARTCGLATVDGHWMRLYLPREGEVDKIELAHTIAHEMGHLRGMQHHQMRLSPVYSRVGEWRELFAWAEAMPVERQAPKPKPDQQLIRFARVLAAEKRWLTKQKRAATALKKLRAQRRRYERVLTAAGKLPAVKPKP